MPRCLFCVEPISDNRFTFFCAAHPNNHACCSRWLFSISWWRQQWKHFRVIGPLWGTPRVAVGFPSQRPVTPSFGVLSELCLKKTIEETVEMPKIWYAIAHYDVTAILVHITHSPLWYFAINGNGVQLTPIPVPHTKGFGWMNIETNIRTLNTITNTEWKTKLCTYFMEYSACVYVLTLLRFMMSHM